MSFIKSKHSGWTWDLKRTPFGGGGGFDPVSAISDAVSSVGQGISDIGVGIDQTVNKDLGGWGTVGALAAAALTGGAALGAMGALDAAAVAGADATAAGMGFSSAAEAIQAGAITAEGLGLPAATTVADLGAVEGTASAGFVGSGAEAGVAGGVSAANTAALPEGSLGGATYEAGAPGFVGPSGTPDIAAANQAAANAGVGYDTVPGFVGPTGTADVAAADAAANQAAAAAGYSPMQIAQAAKQGISVAKLLQGAGQAAGIIPAAANLFGGGLKSSGAASATDPYAQYRPQAAAQLNQLMNQPSAALSQPGYQQQLAEGMKQSQRGAAATGQLMSGAEAAALNQQGQNTFGAYYNTLVGNLMQMSGASQNPASAQTAAQQIAASKQNMMYQNVGTLTSGLGGLASLYNSSAAQTNTNPGVMGYGTTPDWSNPYSGLSGYQTSAGSGLSGIE